MLLIIKVKRRKVKNIIIFSWNLGGLDSKSQVALLRKNPDIIIATPGRLIDHLHNAPSFDLQTIEILVLDEADRYRENNCFFFLFSLITYFPGFQLK